MILSYLRSVQKTRSAARNFRILAALDDDTLLDIGLDRRTLRAFCADGCRPTAAPAMRGPAGPLAVLLAQAMRPALR